MRTSSMTQSYLQRCDQYFYCVSVGQNLYLCEMVRDLETMKMDIIEKKANKKSKMFNKLKTSTKIILCKDQCL